MVSQVNVPVRLVEASCLVAGFAVFGILVPAALPGGAARIIHLSFSGRLHQLAMAALAVNGPVSWSRGAGRDQELITALNRLLAGDGMASRQQETGLPDSPFILGATAFRQRVWQGICGIPAGRTKSYKELATAVGIPGGARAVGQACHYNPLVLIIPCHRVVAANGIGGFAGDTRLKQQLLFLESRGKELPVCRG